METITKNQAEEILRKLSKIEAGMNILAERVIEEDGILTEEDLEAIEKAEKEYREGKTISHEQLKKELGLKCLK